MLAGARIETLKSVFPGAEVVRMMPNTPARIGRGMTALYADDAGAGVRTAVEWLADAAGRWLWLEAEEQFDAVTGLSGSGPAYLFRFIEALADAGVAVGLPADIAGTLALQTVAGAAQLAARSDLSPAKLREQVTSPNGTTVAGLQRLDGDGLLSSLMRSTVRAATERSRQMAAEGEQPQALTLPNPRQGLLP
jgi:pyrroline-5-carboxylate reductase